MKKLIFNLLGYNTLEARKVLHQSKLFDYNDYKLWKDKKIWKIYEYHMSRNSFYKSICINKVSNWEDIPIITKKDFQTNLKSILSNGFNTNNTYIANTSGSSGEPFWYAKDKPCHAIAWEYISQKYSELSEQKTYVEARFFGSVRKGINLKIKNKLKDFILNRVCFDVFDQSIPYLNKIKQTFEKIPFTFAYGYTNSISLFAEYLKENTNKSLKDICPSLKFVLLTAEMCTQEMREELERVMGVPVYREYGSSETSIIAIEDKSYNWNIATERLYLEIVNEYGTPVPYGQRGRILLTDLNNLAMPFIRYDIGDIGSICQINEPPFFILKSLDGRTSDTIYMPGNKRLPGLAFYYITRSLIEDGKSIDKFIIIQKDINQFVLEYIADQELESSLKSDIIEESERYLNYRAKFTFKRVNVIQKHESGKTQHFFSEIN